MKWIKIHLTNCMHGDTTKHPWVKESIPSLTPLKECEKASSLDMLQRKQMLDCVRSAQRGQGLVMLPECGLG